METETMRQANLRNVRLTDESRKQLRKVKDCLWGNVANAIESGNWWIPVKNYKYSHLKETFEDEMYKFFELSHKDANVEIADFITDIIEYDGHE